MMEIHAIPFEDKFIIYRPLMQIAFIGNSVMLEIIERLAAAKRVTTSSDVYSLLDGIGHLKDDPRSPIASSHDFKPIMYVLFATNHCSGGCPAATLQRFQKPTFQLSMEETKNVRIKSTARRS